jgi:hypothetical protein
MSAPAAPSGPTGARASWPWLVAWASLVPLAIYRAGTLTESDTFWQIRAGLLMLAGGSIPRTDSWSWTAAGEPWTMNSWGFNLVLGLAHEAGGLALVALVCAGLAAAAMAAVLRLAARLGASPALAGVFAIVAFALLLGWFSARPQLLDYIALPVLVMMLRALVGSRRPLPWMLACIALTGVWMNLHAAALLGVAVTGALGVLLLLRSTTRGRAWWVLATAAGMTVATVATPYGLQGYGQAESVHGASAGVIAEWAPLNPADPVQLAAVLIGLGGLVCAVRLREPVVAVVLAITSAGGLFAIRLLPLAVLLAVGPLAAIVSSPALLARLRGLRAVTVPAVVVWFVVAGWFGGVALTHPGRPDASLYSPGAIGAIPSGCRTVNTYAVGGYLGLVRPDVPVSIDSRNDLFGAQRVLAATRLVDGTGDTAAGLAGADCVLVPAGAGLAAQLAADPAWEKAAQDSIQVLYERRT